MYIKKMSEINFSFSDDAQSKLIIFDDKKRINVITKRKKNKVLSNLSRFKRISKARYVDMETGEICEYKNNINKGDNDEGIKESIHKIRELIINNFTAFEGFLITLTYDVPMFEFDAAVKDFTKFYDRLKYHYSEYKFDYLRIIEPQQSGGWHIHIILKSADEGVQIRIAQSDVLKIWGLGSATVHQLVDIEGLAKYFGTYHGKKSKNLKSKTQIKQDRWHYYPSGARIFAKSKGIRYPNKMVFPYGEAKEILDGYELIAEPITYSVIGEGDNIVNTVLYENYEQKKR